MVINLDSFYFEVVCRDCREPKSNIAKGDYFLSFSEGSHLVRLSHQPIPAFQKFQLLVPLPKFPPLLSDWTQGC